MARMRCLGRADPKVDHGAIYVLGVGNTEFAFAVGSFGLFLKSLNIIFEVGYQHMITKIFQFAICITLKRLPHILVFFDFHQLLPDLDNLSANGRPAKNVRLIV